MADPALIALTVVAVAALLVVARLVLNKLTGSRPPVFEGVPFIGGMIKFAKVSLAALRSQRGVRTRVSSRRGRWRAGGGGQQWSAQLDARRRTSR